MISKMVVVEVAAMEVRRAVQMMLLHSATTTAEQGAQTTDMTAARMAATMAPTTVPR